MIETKSETAPIETIMQLSSGYWVPRCLHVIAELGIADLIGEEPKTAEVLAQSIGAHPGALARVLRALAAHGVFEQTDEGYRHTPASRLLRTDHPASQRPYVRMMGLPVHWAAYGELAHAVRTGEAAMRRIEPGGTFDYFARHPAEARIFDEAMTAKSHAQIAAVLDAYDFSAFGTIADIGGGRGHLIRAILEAAPRAKGVLFDLPPVIEALNSVATERLMLKAGDFFADPLPACDAYVLMSVIHDWGDAEATAILKSIRRAAPAHAKVILLEMLVPEEPAPHPAKLLDIEMLAMTTGGRERTRAEYERLYAAAGLRLGRVVPTASATMILEGAVA